MKTRLLEEQIAETFMGSMRSTNAAFRRLRDELVERLQQDPAALERMQVVRVPITMEIDSGEIEEISLLDADDFFVHLTAFCKSLAEHRDQAGAAAWSMDDEHVPLVVDSIELSLHRFCITHRVAQAAKTFMNAGVRAQLEQLNLDPRLISCADQDLIDFVATLTKGATNLRIDTGVDLNDDIPEIIDEYDEDRRDVIRLILNAIAKVDHIQELNLGGLLLICVADHNRRELYQAVFRQILARDVLPETITFRARVVFEDPDRAFFEEEAALWRQMHPQRKLCVKDLTLRLMATDVDTLEAFLMAFDDVESIELSNYDMPPLPPRILHRILAYPSLKKVRIGRLFVPSMDIFDPSIPDPILKSKPALEMLVLDDVIVQDSSSMTRFVETLGWDVAEPSVLAKSLRRFHVARGFAWEEMYNWDRAALEALDRVLQTNRTLTDVKVIVDFAEEFYPECERRLLSHHRSTVPVAPDARRSDVVKARNLAFLSTIQSSNDACAVPSARSLVDAVIVRRILEFAAPHVLRRVEVQPAEEL